MKRRDFMLWGGAGVLAAGGGVRSAGAAKARKLTMVTSWPRGFPGLGTSAERVARRIEAASGGQLAIDVRSAGELVGPFETFDAVASGKADLYHSADYYQQHRSRAYNFFTAVPFGMTSSEMAGWLMHCGGQALWDELAASFNIKPFMCTSTGTQMGGWFNREIRSPADFEGLRIRMPGLGGEALAALGAEPVNVAGGEIFTALREGTLDAAEWVGPWNDLAAGLHEVARHYYYPGFHEAGPVLALGINLDVWQTFTETQQEIVREVTAAEFTRSLGEFNVRNAQALKTLEQRHGVVPKAFDDATLADIAGHSRRLLDEMAAEDPALRKIRQSFLDARRDAMQWAAVGEEAFARARRLDAGA